MRTNVGDKPNRRAIPAHTPAMIFPDLGLLSIIDMVMSLVVQGAPVQSGKPPA